MPNSSCKDYYKNLEDIKALQSKFQKELESFKSSKKSETIWETRKEIKTILEFFEKELPKEEIKINYSYTNPETGKIEYQESINLNLESKLQEFLSLYQKTNIDLPPDFKETIKDIWKRNQEEMEKAISEKGFNGMLIIPGNIPLPDLAEKMKMEDGYSTGSNFDASGGFAGAISQNADKPRIILFHKKTLPKIQEENGLDVHLNITAKEALEMFEKNPNEHMNLTDFLIMERKIFEESDIHISDYTKNSGQWLNTKSGARLVDSYWLPGTHGLGVIALDPEFQSTTLGVRPSRCFF